MVAMTLCFRSRFSGTASMTMSALAKCRGQGVLARSSVRGTIFAVASLRWKADIFLRFTLASQFSPM